MNSSFANKKNYFLYYYMFQIFLNLLKTVISELQNFYSIIIYFIISIIRISIKRNENQIRNQLINILLIILH